MKEGFKALINDRVCLGALVFFLVFLIFNFSFLIFNFSRLPPVVPLFYSQPWGEKQLASRGELFLLPFLSLFLFLLNTILAQKFYLQEKIFFRILVWATAILAFLSTWTLYQILKVIT